MKHKHATVALFLKTVRISVSVYVCVGRGVFQTVKDQVSVCECMSVHVYVCALGGSKMHTWEFPAPSVWILTSVLLHMHH